MLIKIVHLAEGARKASGLTVIIDVFRAFSLVCYAFDLGVEKIIPVGDPESAFQLKDSNKEYILAGERNEKPIPGFDFGNSPTHILRADLKNKTVVFTTSAGTHGLVNAVNASELITGSFVNAGAIVRYIRLLSPPEVTLVCMGYAARYPVDEDTFCAEYIRNELEGRETDIRRMFSILKNGSGSRFFESHKQNYAPSSDFYLCTNLDRFDFVVRAEKENQQLILRKNTL